MLLRRIGPFVPWLFLGGAAIGAFLLIAGDDGISHNRTLQTELESQRAQNGALREKLDRSRREVTQLETSDIALEKAARNDLGMAKPDDIIFIFPSKPAKPSKQVSTNTGDLP